MISNLRLETNPCAGQSAFTYKSFIFAALFGLATPLALAEKEAFLPTPPLTVSTAPANGDQNPYGVAFVPPNFNSGSGPLQQGDILVSNFNNNNAGGNLQGTGTTIVRVDSSGNVTLFFTVPNATLGGAGTGLTTALAVLREGIIIVGSIPSPDGSAGNATAGSLLIIDAKGHLLSSITDSTINGPWDMTVIDNGKRATAFVSNAFAGTVVRLELQVSSTAVTVTDKTTIASNYMHRPDASAFVVGPTGLVYDSMGDVLYVASTEDNEIFAVNGAANTKKNGGTGKKIYSDSTHLHGPLGMAEAPNGDLLVANADVINSDTNQPSEIVEFTKKGQFVKQLSVDPSQGGSFGLAVSTQMKNTPIFAAVDDVTGSLIIWTLTD